ncbi:MAG TPA: hypothetical protein VJV79_05650 [Polyangiaceae bacterium]|nr:hypothetical protein [Polyangiaceae bacterium]
MRVAPAVPSVGSDIAQIVASVSGKPKWQPRLLSGQAELSAHAGEGVAFEDAAQLALLQRGAHSDALLLEGCNRFDPGACCVSKSLRPSRGVERSSRQGGHQ